MTRSNLGVLGSLLVAAAATAYGCSDDHSAPPLLTHQSGGSGGGVADTGGAAGMLTGPGGGGSANLGGGGGEGPRTDAFCEPLPEGGAGQVCDGDVPEVDSVLEFRFDLLDPATYPLHFSTPVCAAADKTVLIPRGSTPSDRNTTIDVSFDGSPGAYSVSFNPSDWQPLDTFDLTVRRGVTDVQCNDEPLAQQTAIPVIACHPDGWPSASSCRAQVTTTLDQADCKGDDQTEENITLSFTCGKAVVEGIMFGQPALQNSADPDVTELKAHSYRLEAYMDGTYQVTLDGTKDRDVTIGAPQTNVAQKACSPDVSCESLTTVVQLDVGTSCGDNDVEGKADYTGNCVIETDLTLTKGEVRYLTVRPDIDGGCTGGKPCDYNYALWVRGPDGN